MRAFTICALAALGIACAGSPDAGQSDVIGSDNCGDSVTVELPATVDARIDGPGRFDIREAAADSPYRAELRVEVEEELWDEVLAEELISCACDPPVVFLTINDIPALMNGSEPYLSNSLKMEEFRIAVPTSGFAWNLTVDCPCGCTSAGISVIADAPAGVLEAGESLFGLFEDLGDGKYHWLVGPEHEFAPGPGLTVSAQIMDLCGNLAGPEALTVLVAESTPELDPFDLEDPWLLVYKRDDYSIHVEVDEAGKGLVVSEPEPNGTYDLLEDLWTVGVGTPEPLPEFEQIVCGDFTGGNECLARELLERVREEAYGNFACGADGTKTEESINVRFWIEGEPGAPDPADFAYQFLEPGDDEKSFSMMGFGGGDLSKSLVGLSETLDTRNIQNENNAKKGYGCLTSSLVRYFWELIYENDNLYALAQIALADILPAMGGTPIGQMPGDEQVVDFSIPKEELESLSKDRRVKLETLLDLLALGLGALTVHEMGHSLGLVPYGAPPHGLFAAEKQAAFIENPAGSDGAHIDTDGLNLMQAGPGSGNKSALDPSYLTQKFFFNELNWAYLQGRILVLPE